MAVQLAVGTPLAESLNNAVHTKLLEVGWGTEDDTSLAEFIVLMLVNGKTEDQIAAELASDILPDGEGIEEFSHWLFEQVRSLQGASVEQAIPSFSDATQRNITTVPAAYDSDMTEAGGSGLNNVPTGPKNLRNGGGAGRGSRMMNQVSRAMDRTRDSPLHRVRQGSTDRVNSHSRGAPTGPRHLQNRGVRPGMQKALNGMGMPGMNNMANVRSGSQPSQVSPQQQMEFMAMMEQQAQMFAQFMPGMMPGMAQNMQQNNGKSLFNRVEGPKRGRGGRQQNGHRGNKAPSMGRDTAMEEASGDGSLDGQKASTEPFMTMCRWNTKCTNKTCPFVHQSAAAPEGTSIDLDDTCIFGAACKNTKCAGKHPSPSQIKAHQSEEQCRYHPYCTNASCTFNHPSFPICRNGGDCNLPNCKFTHLTTKCKFANCKNPRCPYKHEEGQRGTFLDNVWKSESVKKEEKDHVSERKFVMENDAEELIKPDPDAPMAQAADVIT